MQKILNSNPHKLLAAMADVKDFETRLAQLNDLWGKITLIGKINSHSVASTIFDEMNRTQNKFGELQRKLTQNLLLENVQKLVLDNASRAQVAIDLLIRNLFERTADVGFLATDDDIRAFLLMHAPSSSQIAFIENRLAEYVKKYSVYDEIIVLDTSGHVKAHLDRSNAIAFSNDPLIKQTLTTRHDYVETFRHSDLQAHRRHSLIYSCKITETDDKGSRALGVLCLCFRFDDEVSGIFANLLGSRDRGLICLLDADGCVIASSDESHLAVNSQLAVRDEVAIGHYQGKDQFFNCRHTNGYQGFYGLGWRGVMMTQLDQAFNRSDATVLDSSCKAMIEQASTFPQELRDIRKASTEINDDLGLLVLNGQIASARKNAAEFMPVLEAIRKIGSDIAQIFNASVTSLQELTVMSSHLNNAGFLASLAVDIMDRNLYERANDCRWWALTSAFRRNLAKPLLTAADQAQMNDILQYINALYTVYTNLYVYDSQGKIVAVSDKHQVGLINTYLDDSTGFSTALLHADSQHYTVSEFLPLSLYQGQHTYIYNAAITDLQDANKVIGGIGIVFDSQPQFAAMLSEILPREKNGQLLADCFAVFTDRKKQIVAVANNPQLQVGGVLPLAEHYVALHNGERSSSIIRYQGKNYVLGVAASKGYREYKTSDNYLNDIIALVFIPF
jgi:hypothetical protein